MKGNRYLSTVAGEIGMVVDEKASKNRNYVVQRVIVIEEEDRHRENEVKYVGLKRVLHVFECLKVVEVGFNRVKYAFEAVLLDPELVPGEFHRRLFTFKAIFRAHRTIAPFISSFKVF